MKTRFLFAFIILLGLICFSACRETMDLPQGEPYLAIDTLEGTVGDWFHLLLAAPGVEDTSIRWPDIHGTMGDLMVLSADTLSGARRRTVGGPAIEYTVSAYDTGAFSTGELELVINGEPVTVGPDTIRIFSVLDATADSTLAPLKGQEELPVTFVDVVRLGMAVVDRCQYYRADDHFVYCFSQTVETPAWRRWNMGKTVTSTL